MKKIWKSLVVLCLVIGAGVFVGCDVPLNGGAGGNIPDLVDDSYRFLKDVKQWKGQKVVVSNKREVALTVTENIDYLYWTKSNGELIFTDRNYRFKPWFYANEKLSFEKRTEPYVFDFSGLEPGNYMLDIHYKDTGKNSDNDFIGFVKVEGNNRVSISDKIDGNPCGEKSPKLGKATLQNDSKDVIKNQFKKQNDGNVITDFYYAEYDRHNTKKRKTNFFKIVYKINISLKPGDSAVVLLPIPKSGTANTESGLIASPVVNDGKVYYFGKMVEGIRKNGFTHPMDGMVNFDVEPIGGDMLSCSWN